MDKNDILDYVTETPGNTNRAVLGSMLDSFAGEGGGSGGGLFVNVNEENALDKTFDEIYNAAQRGDSVRIGKKTVNSEDDYYIEYFALVGFSVDELTPEYIVNTDTGFYVTDNRNGYPYNNS